MNANEQKIPLWRQLQATASVLMAIRSGASGTAALTDVPSELRPGVQALTLHVLRSLGRAEALRQSLAGRVPPPPADALLCTALALAWSDEGAPYDAFTLVNQTVEAAKRNPATRAQGNFVNACLRRFLRERDVLLETARREKVDVIELSGLARISSAPLTILRPIITVTAPEQGTVLFTGGIALPHIAAHGSADRACAPAADAVDRLVAWAEAQHARVAAFTPA